MFQGYFYHDRNKYSPQVVLSTLSQNCVVKSPKGVRYMRQVLCMETSSCVTIAGESSRLALFAHIGACDGAVCSCQNILSHFIRPNDEEDLDRYVAANQAYMKENVKCPYMLILSQGSGFVVVTAYSENDFQVTAPEAGHYMIRDCFLSNCTDSRIVAHFETWNMQASTNEKLADGIADVLKNNLRCYPEQSNLEAQGVSLLKSSTDKAPILITTIIPAEEDNKNGIKGPISQYNFFSMEARKLIRDGDPALEMSNNEWNRLVGKRWRELTPKEHEPFRQMAQQDKKRYEAECAAAGVTVEKRVKQTAYNHFVHQEKQFVAAMNVSNLKYKTGKHCSARWRAMDAEEKKLYATLEQTGSK